jgi:hypothetical protein
MSARAWSLVLLVTGLAGCDLVPLGGSDEAAPADAAPTAAEPGVAPSRNEPASAPAADPKPAPAPAPMPAPDSEPAAPPAAPATAEPAALPPEPAAPPPTPTSAPPNDDDEGVDCPPGADDEHPCRAPLPRGDFSFGEPLAFATPITIDLDPPATMPADRWQVVRSASLPWATLGKELSLERMRSQGPNDLHDDPLWAIDEAFADGSSAGWWWPAQGEPVLAIPCAHRVAIGDDERVVHSLVLARKDGNGWKAAVVPTTLPSHLDVMRERPALVPRIETRVALRYDHLEWLSLSQIFSEGRQAVVEDEKRWACRVAWHDGALRQACTDAWGATGP